MCAFSVIVPWGHKLGTAGRLNARMRYGLKGEPVVADVDYTPVPVYDHSEKRTIHEFIH